MMRLKMSFVFLFVSAMFLVSFPGPAQASSQQETLQQYVADLQKNPDALDGTLLGKIIKQAQEMTPAPVIPAEAVKFADRGEYAAKTAKTESDFADAAEEYKKAMLIAPWVAGYWFNIGVLREKANQPQRAANGFKLYLLAEPNAKDAREVQKRIAGLEYAAEKAAKETSPEAVAAKKQDEREVWLKNLDGARFISSPMPASDDKGSAYLVYYIEGNKVHQGWFDHEPSDFRTASIRQVEFNNKSLSIDIQGKQFVLPRVSWEDRDHTATISDDGQFITFDRGTEVFKRVK